MPLVLVLLLGFVVVGVMRRITGVLEQAESRLATELGGGVPLLTAIPPFELVDDATGEIVSSEDVIQEPTVLLFMEADCERCWQLASALSEQGAANFPLVVVAGKQGLGAGFELPANVPVFRQKGEEVAQLFQSTMTPHAFVVDQAGVVLDRAVPGSIDQLHELARRQRAELGQVGAD